MKKFLKLLTLVIAFCAAQQGTAFAVAGEPSVLLRFSDETRFYRVPSSDILSALMMEKLAASGKFSLRTEQVVDAAREIPQNGMEQTGDSVAPDALKAIGAKYGANYAISGTIERLGTAHMVYRDLGNAASTAGQIASIFTGGIVGSILGAFGGASTTKDTLGVAVHIAVLDVSDGHPIWEKDFAAVEAIGKEDPNADMVTVGGVQTNRTLAKAMESIADAAVQALIEDVGQNRLLIK